MGIGEALVTFVAAYFLVAVVAALWGARFLAKRKPDEWKKDKVSSIMFALYFGVTWPAIFIDGLLD